MNVPLSVHKDHLYCRVRLVDYGTYSALSGPDLIKHIVARHEKTTNERLLSYEKVFSTGRSELFKTIYLSPDKNRMSCLVLL